MWKSLCTVTAVFWVTHHVLDGGEYLSKRDLAGAVGHLSLRVYVVVQVSSSSVLHHQVEPAGRVHHLVQAHHVGMLQGLHTADLPRQETLGRGVQPGLVQDLQGHFVCIWEERKLPFRANTSHAFHMIYRIYCYNGMLCFSGFYWAFKYLFLPRVTATEQFPVRVNKVFKFWYCLPDRKKFEVGLVDNWVIKKYSLFLQL